VQEAVRRAGRVDVVREAAGITAYRTGRYAEALRELRTARRLNGSDEHVPLMADCERGLGRPERALALGDEHGAGLPLEARVELAIVVSGARLDMGQPEAAVAALNAAFVRSVPPPTAWRVAEARAEALRACGRIDEAAAVMATIPAEALGVGAVELIEVVDLADDVDDSVDVDVDDDDVVDADGLEAVVGADVPREADSDSDSDTRTPGLQPRITEGD
jgi:hypothetical protein